MVDILKRRVIIYPLVSGPVYVGNADDDTVAFDAVPLTVEHLQSKGGAGLQEGVSWSVRLALKYLDSDGAQTATDLSGASGLVMHIWHKLTAEFVDNRTEDAVIADSGGLVELAIDGDGTAGTITIIFHEGETLTSGHHNWAITGDWTLSEVLAAGTIDIKQSMLTS